MLTVSYLRYADDIILLAISQVLLDKHDSTSQEFGLLINVNKTRVMTLKGCPCNTVTQGTTLEQVSSFSQLSSVITEDGKYGVEISARLGKAYGISISLTEIWKSHDMSVRTKLRLLQTLCVAGRNICMRELDSENGR